MDIFELPEHDKHAGALLRNILNAIQTVFPDAKLTINPDESNNNIVFSIRRGDGERGVEVTEAFLDADDGLNSALHCLVGLPAHLRRLGAGDVLMVTDVGLQPKVFRRWRAIRVILAALVINLQEFWSLAEVGCM